MDLEYWNLEFKILHDKEYLSLIKNYHEFNRVNNDVLELLAEMEEEVWDVSYKESKQRVNFSQKIDKIIEKYEVLLKYMDNPSYEGVESTFHSKEYYFCSEKLNDISKSVRIILEKIDLYNNSGYFLSRNENINDNNTEFGKLFSDFNKLFGGASSIDLDNINTFEDLLRFIHETYLVAFERHISYYWDDSNQHYAKREIVNNWSDIIRHVIYLTPNDSTSPHMEKIRGIMNRVLRFNHTKLNAKNREELYSLGWRGTGFIEDMIFAYFTDANAYFYIGGYYIDRDSITHHIFYDDSKEYITYYLSTWTKGNMIGRREFSKKFFKENGWNYNINNWSSKTLNANIKVPIDDFEEIFIKAFLYNEYFCNRLRIEEISDFDKYMDEYIRDYKKSKES